MRGNIAREAGISYRTVTIREKGYDGADSTSRMSAARERKLLKEPRNNHSGKSGVKELHFSRLLFLQLMVVESSYP